MMFAKDKSIGILNYQGLVLMGMYLLGFGAALLAALILKHVLKTTEKSYFIMELPVYRKPQWQTVAMLVFDKVKVFLFEAGKIIVAISIILWLMASFAPGNRMQEIEQKYTSTSFSEEEKNLSGVSFGSFPLFGLLISSNHLTI
jgi:ferrous iron transport protein B